MAIYSPIRIRKLPKELLLPATEPIEPDVIVDLDEDELKVLRDYSAQQPDAFRKALNFHGVNDRTIKLLTRMYPEKNDAQLSDYFRQPPDGRAVLMSFLGRRKKKTPMLDEDKILQAQKDWAESTEWPLQEPAPKDWGIYAPGSYEGLRRSNTPEEMLRNWEKNEEQIWRMFPNSEIPPYYDNPELYNPSVNVSFRGQERKSIILPDEDKILQAQRDLAESQNPDLPFEPLPEMDENIYTQEPYGGMRDKRYKTLEELQTERKRDEEFRKRFRWKEYSPYRGEGTTV